LATANQRDNFERDRSRQEKLDGGLKPARKRACSSSRTAFHASCGCSVAGSTRSRTSIGLVPAPAILAALHPRSTPRAELLVAGYQADVRALASGEGRPKIAAIGVQKSEDPV
jgi:hypothetical protein